MGTEIYNTTIGRMVEVPDAHVAQYLADPRYLAQNPALVPEDAADQETLEELTQDMAQIEARISRKGKST